MELTDKEKEILEDINAPDRNILWVLPLCVFGFLVIMLVISY